MTPPGWTCPRRIGFLFPHPCERTTQDGCPDCQNGQVGDPYRYRFDRYDYTNYDEYSTDWTGAAAAGFTEADGERLVKPRDLFEDDMSAS